MRAVAVARGLGLGRERDERHGQRQSRQPHQEQDVVVTGGLVEPEPAAIGTPMDEDPTALAADRDRDRFHATGAVGLAVTRDVAVEMARPQTTRTMVAMGGSRGVEGDLYAAVLTAERTCECQTEEPFRAKLLDRTDIAFLLPVPRRLIQRTPPQKISTPPAPSID